MTIFAVICFIMLLALFGTLPALLLLRPDDGASRILLTPALGLSTGVLFTCSLAAFGLTGRSISLFALIFVPAAIAVLAICRKGSRTELSIASNELIGAVPGVLTAVTSVILIGWPIFYRGHETYWGFANPDQAFYMAILKNLQTHPFGLPPNTGVDTSVILGVSYLLSMLALITKVPVEFLYGVACTGMLFLIPISTCVLAEWGFGLPRWKSIVAGFMIALSSVVAQTFYLHSLGALSVLALVPAGIALAIRYTNAPLLKNAVLLALCVVGMYYCYYPGFGVMSIAVGVVLLSALVRRKIRFRRLLVLGAFTVGIAALVFLPQADAILKRLLRETFSGRLAVAQSSDEVQLSFALVLTEQVVPFFWGFSHPGSLGLLPGSPQAAFFAVFVPGAVLLIFLLMSMLTRVSELTQEYAFVLLALLSVTCIYIAGANAYGVFKLLAWIQPLAITGVAAACIGSAQAMRKRGFNIAALLPVLALLTHSTFNLVRTLQFGRMASGLAAGSMHNLPGYGLDDFRSLANLPEKLQQNMIVALPDPVVQRWAAVFIGPENPRFAPQLTLNSEDSDSPVSKEYLTDWTSDLNANYVLHWRKAEGDIVSPPKAEPVWNSRTFALTPFTSCRDTLVLGAGWYRKEAYPDAPFAWLHRFRWFRKRAEAILINPAPGLHRLRMTLFAGYGNQSPSRHLILWVNGQKLQQVQFTGYARILSGSFLAASPWTHLEFEIREDASLIPREFGLWNRWIPQDPRHLNVAVSELALVSDQDGEVDLDTQLNLISETKPNDVLFDGIYPDRWIGQQAEVQLRVPSRANAVEITGTVPDVSTFRFPYAVRAFVNGSSVGEKWVTTPGSFHLQFPLDNISLRNGNGTLTITIKPESTFVGSELGLNQDRRRLSLLLDGIRVL